MLALLSIELVVGSHVGALLAHVQKSIDALLLFFLLCLKTTRLRPLRD